MRQAQRRGHGIVGDGIHQADFKRPGGRDFLRRNVT